MKRKFDQVDNQTTNQAIKIHKKSEPMEELQSKLTEDPDFIYHIYDELTDFRDRDDLIDLQEQFFT